MVAAPTTALPRLVIAAASTGQGKTTIATGLMAALRLTGHEVSGHKVGPDYIDPGYHSLATGRPGRNLDPHLVGEEQIVPLLLHGAAGADVAVIEGVMGLYDGRLGTDGFASTAHVAQLTGSPVVLVVDVSRMSRTAAAVAAGMVAFDDRVNIAGVVLNHTGSVRNDAEIVAAMESAGLSVFGLLTRDSSLETPSRHLGLVTAAERHDSAALIERLGQKVAQHLDLDALLAAARTAPDLAKLPWDPSAAMRQVAGRPVVAMAGGRAFTFRYAETEELLTAAGCEVVTFDPMTDSRLPARTQGIYLGGGFPEVYAAELAANKPLLRDLRAAVESGVPTVVECAGLLYLASTLDGTPMAGVLPVTAAMGERLTLRYPVAHATADSLLTRRGEQVTGHEFHRTHCTPASGVAPDWAPAWSIDNADTGFASKTLHASYLHTHWAGYPHLAQRFADAAAVTTDRSKSERDLLLHHGDVEVGEGLLDFAVNVFAGARPSWLETALRDSLADASAYPDASGAAAALAKRHGRAIDEVLPTAGAAEAFTLIAALPWRRPVVVHPQFTEPHAALQRAGHHVTSVMCAPDAGFVLDPTDIPDDADLVMIGNPTNPTGVLHPSAVIGDLCREGRVVVVDEAFMDAVPDEPESLAGRGFPGLIVLRSLTKHWSIPGIRAGYGVGDVTVIEQLAWQQTPWSVSSPAIAAMTACSSDEAMRESQRRAVTLASWRSVLESGLVERGVEFVPSVAPFVLARVEPGVHAALRELGVALRRADTFPGLDSAWVRIAVRPPETTARLLAVLDQLPHDSHLTHRH